MKQITEHSTTIKVAVPKQINAKMPVFYNPAMASNRNISILLLNSIPNKKMDLADPLAGSGIRSLRFLKELKKNKIKRLFVNDNKKDFIKVFNENLKLNNLKKEKFSISSEDAARFQFTQHTENFCGYFDYIDIDPFGSPNPFLSAAIMRIKRKGILAVTATDTAALTGTYPKVTKRKYWAQSFKNYLMHETGLRILIRKIQLQGVQFDKALIPILSYFKDYYFRVYLRSEKGKERCDELLKEHQYFLSCPHCLNYKTSYFNKEWCSCGRQFLFSGLLWTGKLFEKKLIEKMAKDNPFPEEQKFLDLLREESQVDVPGFINLHTLAKKLRTETPKMSVALKELKGTRTHFSENGVKTEKRAKDLAVCKIFREENLNFPN